MRQQVKVMLEMLAKRRSEHIAQSDQTLTAKLAMDDSGLRCALQVFRGEELERLEFIESDATAGQARFYDDYIEVAGSTGALVLHFPESKYSRDMAMAVYQSILAEVRKRTGREVTFQGFVYDDKGNFKRTG